MFFGWIACNAVFALHALMVMQRPMTWIYFSRNLAALGIYTGVVILASWLLIFLPVDLIVRDDSKLRRPRTAAICGFFAALFTVIAFIALGGLIGGEHWTFTDIFMIPIWVWKGTSLPYTLGAVATGTVAAFSRCWLDDDSPLTKRHFS